MKHLPDHFRACTGRRRYAYAFALGGTLTLTMPPIGFFIAALISVPGFIWLAQGAETKRQSFLTGWAYGGGYFITGLYWISAALFVDIAQWGWVLPLSLIVGPALLALMFYSFIPLLAHHWRHHHTAHTLLFCTIWAAIEWLRGHILTGFPWNLPGYMWQHVLPVAQITAVVGIYGLTLLTLLWAAVPALWSPRRLRLVMIASFIAVLSFGFIRLLPITAVASDQPLVRIVQGNLPQTAKWDKEEQARNLALHTELSDRTTPADIVVWPETAVTQDMILSPDTARFIASQLPPGSVGILGSLRVTGDIQVNPAFHNGLYVLDSDGRVLDSYDKFHLVPFGEYIPFRRYLNMTPIAAGISGIGDFTPGPGPRTLALDGRIPPFSPLICYEVIFPGNVTDKANRPAWLVNFTNDAWYGRSAGPYQHVEISRIRAIEEGLPLVRAANTGISIVVDAYGRTTAQLGLNERGALTTRLPDALPPTLYARWGDAPFAVLLLLTLLIARRFRPRKQISTLQS